MLRSANRLAIVFLVQLLVLAPPCAAGQIKECSVCGKELSGRYVERDAVPFCSVECLEERHPPQACAACGTRISGEYYTLADEVFCSRDCVETRLQKCILCGALAHATIDDRPYCEDHSSLPACSACQQPAAKTTDLGDGRHLCGTCDAVAVRTRSEASAIYDRAWTVVQEITGARLIEPPPFRLVTLTELSERRRVPMPPNAYLQGFYSSVQVTTERRGVLGQTTKVVQNARPEVYLLTGMLPDQLEVTAVHELTHHVQAVLLRELDGAPGWVVEGLAQYVAATHCLRTDRADLLSRIEESELPHYGDGYRYFYVLFGRDNWPGVKRWLARTDVSRLPPEVPTPEARGSEPLTLRFRPAR